MRILASLITNNVLVGYLPIICDLAIATVLLEQSHEIVVYLLAICGCAASYNFHETLPMSSIFSSTDSFQCKRSI